MTDTADKIEAYDLDPLNKLVEIWKQFVWCKRTEIKMVLNALKI